MVVDEMEKDRGLLPFVKTIILIDKWIAFKGTGPKEEIEFGLGNWFCLS